ncbi:MAG: LCP family protein [Clostridiales bacterium]|nr:LCP family protein [Clostridiales bacterium]
MLTAIRNFVIVFAISAVIFGVIGYAITGFIVDNVLSIANSPDETGISTDTDTSNDSETTKTPDTDNIPKYEDLEGRSFNILLIGTDYRPDDFNDYKEDFLNGTVGGGMIGMLKRKVRPKSADYMMLIRVNEEKREITFTEIPKNTRVTVYEKQCLLGPLYGDYGVESIVNFVNYLTSVTIDYYICVNVTDAASIINIIDGVTINVPVDILNPYYNPKINPEDEDYEKKLKVAGITGDRDFQTEIAIEAGENLINGDNIFALLHYRTKDGSYNESQRNQVLLDLTKAVIEKAISKEYLNDASELFARAISYAETNMTFNDLISNIGIFKAYDEFTKKTLSYPGTTATVEGVNYFIPSVTEAYAIFRSADSLILNQN